MSRVVDTGVIPECYVDTNLTETLTGIICNHQKGCANVVLNKIKKGSSFFPHVPFAQGSLWAKDVAIYGRVLKRASVRCGGGEDKGVGFIYRSTSIKILNTEFIVN